jgi:hypothetical protein
MPNAGSFGVENESLMIGNPIFTPTPLTVKTEE